MSARRVAYLVNQYPKTSHSFVRREIHALEDLGWQVERFAIREVMEPLVERLDEEERRRTRVLRDTGWHVVALALSGALFTRPRQFGRSLRQTWGLWRRSESIGLRPFGWLIVACVLAREVRRLGLTHVHAHFGSNSAAVALLVNAVGGPGFSFTVHGTSAFDSPSTISLREKVLAARFVAAVSDFGRAQLMRWSPRSVWGKLHVVRCGLDGEFLERAVSAPPQARRVVCVARLSAEKGLAVLMQALTVAKARGRSFELAVVGDGEQRAPLEALARRLGVAECVKWLGWGDTAMVQREILASRALVLPSLAEGLPVVIMEAFALGRPVVASAVGAVSELVISRETGWLVPAGAPEALGAALCEVLDADVSELERLASRGRELVRERHVAREQAQRLAELFDAVQAGGAA